MAADATVIRHAIGRLREVLGDLDAAGLSLAGVHVQTAVDVLRDMDPVASSFSAQDGKCAREDSRI